jgi:hypothetical protein
VVVLVIVLVWLVALVPVALRRHSAHRVTASVARFRRQRRLLERAYRSRVGNDDVTFPVIRGIEPHARENVRRHSPSATISDLHLRRRRVLSAFGGALVISLILGAMPGLSAFWTISIVLAASLTAYVVLLARFAAAQASFPGRHRADGRSELRVPEDWVTRQYGETDDVLDRDLPRVPWVRLLVEEQSA